MLTTKSIWLPVVPAELSKLNVEPNPILEHLYQLPLLPGHPAQMQPHPVHAVTCQMLS